MAFPIMHRVGPTSSIVLRREILLAHTDKATGQFFTDSHWIYLMSKKRLLAIIVLSATLAATGAVAHVTHAPLDATNRGVAAQGDAEEAVIRRLLEQFRTVNTTQSGGSDRRAFS